MWVVYSKSGKKMGAYTSKNQAQKRLNQIEMFKHIKGEMKDMAIDVFAGVGKTIEEEEIGWEEDLTTANFYVPTEDEYEQELAGEPDEEIVCAANLFENIRKKKDRMGKKYRPAKPGEKGRPTPEAWKKATQGDEAEAKQMTRKSINDLPDSDFAYIEPGGKKDEEGKTVPRSLRHLPIHDAAHVRNALARLPLTKISEEAKKSAYRKIKEKAKKFGIMVKDKKSNAELEEYDEEMVKAQYHVCPMCGIVHGGGEMYNEQPPTTKVEVEVEVEVNIGKESEDAGDSEDTMPDSEDTMPSIEDTEMMQTKSAEYQGRKVTLNKPFRTPGGPKKFAVYTKNATGKVVIVRFGDPNMKIKKNIPERRRNFRARHNCDTPGPKWKARYWSCKAW